MSDTRSDTHTQARRREAVDNARAIVAFAGGHCDAEMEALNERYIAGDLTSDQVIAEVLRQAK